MEHMEVAGRHLRSKVSVMSSFFRPIAKACPEAQVRSRSRSNRLNHESTGKAAVFELSSRSVDLPSRQGVH
jgi:hypothetical protein